MYCAIQVDLACTKIMLAMPNLYQFSFKYSLFEYKAVYIANCALFLKCNVDVRITHLKSDTEQLVPWMT